MVNTTHTRAQDVMQADVLRLHTATPIDAAGELMEEYSISGAPVVDEAEELVGVSSATDILRRDQAHVNSVSGWPTSYYSSDPLDRNTDEFFSRTEYDIHSIGRELVVDWMTPKLLSVTPDAPMCEVCALMADKRIHRVFVVEGHKLLGVISTFDVVSWLAVTNDN